MVRDWTDPRDGTQWKVRITLARGSMDLEDPFATVKVFRVRFGRPCSAKTSSALQLLTS